MTAVAGHGSALVSWAAPIDDGESPVTGYTVTASPGGATASTSSEETTVRVPDLEIGEEHTFVVVATNRLGDSARSAPSNGVVPTGPPAAVRSSFEPHDDAALADGSAAVSLVVTLVDLEGRPVPGEEITVGSARSGDVLSPPDGTTDVDGRLVVALSGIDGGYRTVTATVGALDLQATAYLTALACEGETLRGGVGPRQPLGAVPYALVTADFDGDGHADVASVGYDADAVSVLLGNGKGSFAARVDHPVGHQPSALEVGDLDGDGRGDLVVAHEGSAEIHLLWGNGDGTFAPGAAATSGDVASGLAIGDVDGDANLDVVVAHYETDSVEILLGDGAGGLTPSGSHAVGFGPIDVVLADFDGDSRLDIATADTEGKTVSILLASEEGGFEEAMSLYADQTFNLTVVDLNDDDIPDLVSSGVHGAGVFVGNGDGTFSYGGASGPLPYGSYVALADFNDDGAPDLVETAASLAVVGFWPGNGDGTFGERTETAILGGSPLSTVAADFNDDGLLDLAIAQRSGHNLELLFGNGDGTFQGTPLPDETYLGGTRPYAIETADFDGDGLPDLAVVDHPLSGSSEGTVRIYPSMAGGGPVPPLDHPVGMGPYHLRAADFDADGHVDLAVSELAGSDYLPVVRILLGNGDATFADGPELAVEEAPWITEAADLDGDGHLDLVALLLNDTLSVFLGRGDGTFEPSAVYPTGTRPYSVVVEDLDGDGALDLLTANWGSDDLSLLPGNDDGTFELPSSIGLDPDSAPTTAIADDFDGDGRPDLAVGYADQRRVAVLIGTGPAAWAPPVLYAASTGDKELASGDFDGDGRLDLAVLATAGDTLSILPGAGDGAFGAAAIYGVMHEPSRLAVADFDGDGRLDFAASSYEVDDVTVMRTTCAP